jgi:hypothetical protein
MQKQGELFWHVGVRLLPIMDSIDCLVHMEMVVGKELASLVT